MRERSEGQQVLAGIPEHGGHVGELALEHVSDLIELAAGVGGVGLGEHGAQGGGDHLGRGLGHPGQDVPR